ncbi:MAG: Coenzyme F420 hydrogenase/dehydrogenase, beta subunit C-terminal domain [Methanomicrobia archaeon]|nr:Coenzyme F420 hydrogenase/dehydrogenase, beta subunit C-terminal domain [Methanomicrobia archaeon]
MAREAVPNVGETAAKKYVRLPTFLERGFMNLANEVTAKRICCLCGTCAAFCDKIEIGESEEGKQEPVFVEDYDSVCGLCYTFCPRTFLPQEEIERRLFGTIRRRAEDELLGVYRSVYAARARRVEILEHAQDGGAVTALLAYALETGLLDCAVITTSDEQWRPKTKIARTSKELLEGAGTKYTLYPSVTGVRDALNAGCEKIGFVGLPCQIQGLRKVQTANQPYDLGIEKVKLMIGLFCMENFTPELLDYVAKQRSGGSMSRIRKFEIRGKDLFLYDQERQGIPLREIKDYIGDGCLVCMDYTAELADLSVGSVGSEEGWSTILVRTEQGETVLKGALNSGYLEATKIARNELESIQKLAKRKKESNAKRRW